MATYSLDQLRADIERKYGPFVIELGEGRTATLEPMLRLDKASREQFTAKHRQLQAMQEDGDGSADLDGMSELLTELLRTVARKDGSADRLLAVLPDELAFRMELFEQYAEATQTGEASPSET